MLGSKEHARDRAAAGLPRGTIVDSVGHQQVISSVPPAGRSAAVTLRVAGHQESLPHLHVVAAQRNGAEPAVEAHRRAVGEGQDEGYPGDAAAGRGTRGGGEELGYSPHLPVHVLVGRPSDRGRGHGGDEKPSDSAMQNTDLHKVPFLGAKAFGDLDEGSIWRVPLVCQATALPSLQSAGVIQ